MDSTYAMLIVVEELLKACRSAKKLLQPDLVEPGRTVFWELVDAIAKAEGLESPSNQEEIK